MSPRLLKIQIVISTVFKRKKAYAVLIIPKSRSLPFVNIILHFYDHKIPRDNYQDLHSKIITLEI